MALTPDGRVVMATLLSQRLQGGVIVVSDGNGASTSVPMTVAVQDGQVVCVGEFNELAGNFDWRVRRVVDAAGTVVDEEAEDMGRKAPGSVWTLEAVIELAAESETDFGAEA
jgi:hypothetical protein